MRRRSAVKPFFSSFDASSPKMRMTPRVGRNESSINRKSVVLPAPDGPVRNWKLCGAMLKFRSRENFRAHSVSEAYIFEMQQDGSRIKDLQLLNGALTMEPAKCQLVGRPVGLGGDWHVQDR